MIPQKFGLFWSGAELSFLRFLTFVSLRKHHPNAEIELWVSNKSNNSASWRSEKQDFQSAVKKKCYLKDLKSLNVKVIERDLFPTYSPNYQSDFFRWWWLFNNGGFYLDTDQIILKPFDDLLDIADFIFSMYNAESCGVYSPVGVIGASKNNGIVEDIMNKMPSCYDPSDYNSLGPFMFRELYANNIDDWKMKSSMLNAPPNIFYPVPESRLIGSVYESQIHFAEDSYCVHWYGGHPKSQEFNDKFTEESLEGNWFDTITVLAKPLIDWYRR
jgi:hypothetical protein